MITLRASRPWKKNSTTFGGPLNIQYWRQCKSWIQEKQYFEFFSKIIWSWKDEILFEGENIRSEKTARIISMFYYFYFKIKMDIVEWNDVRNTLVVDHGHLYVGLWESSQRYWLLPEAELIMQKDLGLMTHQEGLTVIEIVNRENNVLAWSSPFNAAHSLVANDQILTTLRTKRNCKGPFNLDFLVNSPNGEPFDLFNLSRRKRLIHVPQEWPFDLTTMVPFLITALLITL